MLNLEKASALHGTVHIPGDKSISHRSVMFGSLANGDTHIVNFLNGADCNSTIDCMRRLGVEVEHDPDRTDQIIVHGKGLHGFAPQSDPVILDTGNSGTTTRILSGILAGQNFTAILSGDASVNRRPMKRIMDPLSLMGAQIRSLNNNNCAPLEIHGGRLHGITYHTPVASAQLKSAILCAGLYADSQTTVIEPFLSRDHTERMLRAFGADVTSKGSTASLQPCTQLSAQDIVVPGDISSAAYFIAAASIVPGSEIMLCNVGMNPTRDGILRAAEAMGASIQIVSRTDAAEPYADLLVRYKPLHGTVIEGAMIPTLIDELPIIAIMAAVAEGTTIIRDAAELKVKESDRIATVTENLKAMGADITPTDDGYIIHGGRTLHGALIHTYGDHRLAMSFAIAALAADGTTVLDDEHCAKVSYPGFFTDLSSLH